MRLKKPWLLVATLLGLSLDVAGQGADRGAIDKAGRMTPVDAARLLTQGTFGPTFDEINEARTIGADGWVDRQLSLPPSSHLAFLDSVAFTPADPNDNVRMEAWLQRALYAPDQLRQRVAFALSQVFVVSERLPALSNQAEGLASYYDVLVNGAFGSYRDLLGQVTRHPAMGIYLSMRGNRKADENARIQPDENFARESMQLFSIGLWMLNPDGTVLDGDPTSPGVQPVPTYDEKMVRELARVYTGWNWPSCAEIPEERASDWPACGGRGEWRAEMAPTEWAHDRGAKQLLNHTGLGCGDAKEIPAGLDARAELDLVLDHLAAHPNVGPFLARQLIQRLVTSNPSPDYVERVAEVFADDGHGQRGNLGAVVAAILIDPEARDPRFVGRPGYGKLREPLLRRTHVLRALGAKTLSGRISQFRPSDQAPLASPSVFNFYRPDYAPIGEVATAGLVAPEFAITTEAEILYATNEAPYAVWDYMFRRTQPTLLFADMPREGQFAYTGSELVDRYGLLFMNGRMRKSMRNQMIAEINQMPLSAFRETTRYDRVSVAVTLIVASPAYAIQQ